MTKFNPPGERELRAYRGQKLAVISYGSRLYGTATPSSDHDYKLIYMPALDDFLMARKMNNFKVRVDADGNRITDDKLPMSPGGVETEYIALPTLLNDWFQGQTYAVECVFAVLAHHKAQLTNVDFNVVTDLDNRFFDLCVALRYMWQTRAVSGMVGFAVKQTMDYIHRGSRLREAQFFLDELKKLQGNLTEVKGNWRLDSEHIPTGKTGYDVLMEAVDASEYAGIIKATVTKNGNRDERSIAFGGRFYVETTPVAELVRVIQKRVDSYGTRSNDASTKEVDPKSLMHAVRVYQQVSELLRTDELTYPRPNREELLDIRNLVTPMDEIVEKMRMLDEEVIRLQELYPDRMDDMRASFQEYTLSVLRWMLNLPDKRNTEVDFSWKLSTT